MHVSDTPILPAMPTPRPDMHTVRIQARVTCIGSLVDAIAHPERAVFASVVRACQSADPRNYFDQPVDPQQAPAYYDKIEHPMCLADVRRRIAEDHYADADALAADLQLIVDNAMSYNAPDTKFYRAAERVQETITHAIPMVREICPCKGGPGLRA